MKGAHTQTQAEVERYLPYPPPPPRPSTLLLGLFTNECCWPVLGCLLNSGVHAVRLVPVPCCCCCQTGPLYDCVW